MSALTPSAALAAAIDIAGCDDFGPDGYQQGLERCLDAFARMPLLPAVREGLHKKVIQDLATRLKIEQWYKAHPEIASHPVQAPVFVVGLPRTGTTATVAMLALDDRFRFLRAWEGTSPVPPPIAGEEATDPRAATAREAAKKYQRSHIHLSDPDGPEEDLALLSGLDMHAYYGYLPMPEDYLAWWQSEDFISTYAYLERVFQLLHSRRPPYRWLLKSPPHLFRLDAIARRFPDARFVMTHRDPLKVLPSVASLQFMMNAERCTEGALDKQETGRKLLAFWKEGMRRGLAARAAIGEERFIDVRNEDVIKQPLEVFARIYEHLEMNLTPEVERRLGAYSERNAPGAHGSHKYTLDEYGLSAASVRSAFAAYIDRFKL